MQEKEQTFQIRIISSLAEIKAEDWDNLARCKRDDGSIEDNPFLTHAFLSSLEQSGSATAETGWLGQHLLLERATSETSQKPGEVLAVLPCYLKNHSQGEYVFDHGWADAFYRAGGEYYPKLQSSVPFTPATGPRLLVGQAANPDALKQALLSGLMQLTERLEASSAHITFITEADRQAAEQAGFLMRTDRQFHWHNKGYGNFDDFLADLSSRKRKNIKKEREGAALVDGLKIERLTGSDLTEAHWDAFFSFYTNTGTRKWGRPYLTRSFFSRIGEKMANRIVLVLASRNQKPIAGALNFVGDDCLYGRHWGAVETHPFLHFELCYYQAIEHAIAHKLTRVEAGAQGEHKLARGYLPIKTRSAHYVAHPGFRAAIADYLEGERRYVDNEAGFLGEHSPFKKPENAEETEQ